VARIHVEVRPLRRAELARLTSELPGLPFAPENKHETRLRAQELGHDAYLVAWVETRPVGHVVVRLAPHAKSARLEDLFVAQDVRRQGVATALLEAAETKAVVAGASVVGFSVALSNAAASRLYERAGYAPVGAPFVSGYTYWDEAGRAYRDEEPHRELFKELA
jgi:ribosomal protein S18 acetylase RimI-like enzyme